jgi:hypothetical protein
MSDFSDSPSDLLRATSIDLVEFWSSTGSVKSSVGLVGLSFPQEMNKTNNKRKIKLMYFIWHLIN